ncbi:MAG: DUF975 family protein [Enterococcus sp.]
MKSSAQLKADAKFVLKGRWSQAVLMNLVPTLIQLIIGLIILVPLLIFFFTTNDASSISSMSDTANGGSPGGGGGGIISSVLSALFLSGISWTYLDLLRGDKLTISPLKDACRAFSRLFLGGVIAIVLFTLLFTTLWTLLLIIPGIVKSYAYSQSSFVYYDVIQGTGEKPKALDTITASRKLMKGYKMKLFWLDISFIGWHILAILTLGIGYLWLSPYITATKAAFYENLPKDKF